MELIIITVVPPEATVRRCGLLSPSGGERGQLPLAAGRRVMDGVSGKIETVSMKYRGFMMYGLTPLGPGRMHLKLNGKPEQAGTSQHHIL